MYATQTLNHARATSPEGYPGLHANQDVRRWVAVFTVPQNERSVVRHLEMRQVESFLPTCETAHVWKNRQRVKIAHPLFPTYVFARIQPEERTSVLRSTGVLRIIGNKQGPLAIPDNEMEFLRSDFCRERVESYQELVVGEWVRIRTGAMRGVQGVLVRKKTGLRFVLTLELINQHAAIEVDADEVEPILNLPPIHPSSMPLGLAGNTGNPMRGREQVPCPQSFAESAC